MGEAYAATYCINSRGTGILINKNIPFSLIALHKDQYGHYLITCTIYGERYMLASFCMFLQEPT